MNEHPRLEGDSGQFRYHGRLGELYGIYLVNLLAKVLTLGIYHFWAKTRMRQYLWSQTAFEGERFEYSGAGRELFLGYLKAMAIVIPALLLFDLAATFAAAQPVVSALIGLLFYAVLFGFGGVIRFASRRYRLGRTRWRGIRFGMSGSAVEYGLKAVGLALLTAVTLGLYYPHMRNRLMAYQLSHAWFGTVRLEYVDEGRVVYRPFFWRWLVSVALLVAVPGLLLAYGYWGGGMDGPGSLPTLIFGAPVLFLVIGAALVVVWLSYLAVEYSTFARRSRLGEMRFTLDFPEGRLVWIYVSSALLYVFTLGLAYPYVVTRSLRFLCRHLDVEGTLDYAAIAQSEQEAQATGEGLMDALDIGDIGI